jgi:hypothetical protein
MSSDQPFKKSFVCAGIFAALIIGLAMKANTGMGGERIGYVCGTFLIPAIVTGIWGNSSDKEWSWGRYAITVFLIYLVLSAITIAGKVK